MKQAFHYHIRLLLKSPQQECVPAPPDADDFNHFTQHFVLKEEAEVSMLSVLSQNAPALNNINAIIYKIQLLISTNRNPIVSCWRGLSDQWIGVIFSCVATAGLCRWAPDFLGDPQSVYNFIHEQIMVNTFRRICIAQGYHHMNPDMSLVNAGAFLTSVYQSFVFAYLSPIVKKEIGRAGQAYLDQKRIQANDRRHAVSTFRLQNH